MDHALLAVADAEHWHARLEDRRRHLGRAFLQHAGGAARKDDGFGLVFGKRLFRRGIGHDFGIDVRLAHAPGDQLGELAAEIDDQDKIGDG